MFFPLLYFALFLYSLPDQTQVATQDHIITQWTMAQAQLATLAYPKIGSITTITESGQPVIGKLSTAAAEGLDPQGPFSTTNDYFTALGQAALRRTELQEHELNQDSASFSRLGAFVSSILYKRQAFSRHLRISSPSITWISALRTSSLTTTLIF